MESPASKAPASAIVLNRNGTPCFRIKAKPPFADDMAIVVISDAEPHSPIILWMSMTPEGARVMALQLQAAADLADQLQAAHIDRLAAAEEQAALA